MLNFKVALRDTVQKTAKIQLAAVPALNSSLVINRREHAVRKVKFYATSPIIGLHVVKHAPSQWK